jgi:uroporphyrinogen decarboxylase
MMLPMTESSSHPSSETDGDFAGLRVLSFESRRAVETARMIEKFGGLPFVSPSMREVPVERSAEVVRFAKELITGQVDLVVFMTGVGVRHLMEVVGRHVDKRRFLDSLADVVTVARGPKPVVALREFGLTPTHLVPEPNTWRELLETLDQKVRLTNLTVALQEYGKPNPSLVAGLEARGAQVMTLQVYEWDLPEDVGPLEENVRRLARGEADVVLFTSAQQAHHVLQVAERLGLLAEAVAGLQQAVVGSVGPTTSETLQELGLPVDLEPTHPKLGHLVAELAHQARGMRLRKQGLRRVQQDSTGQPDAASGSPGNSSKEKAAGHDANPPASRAPWYDSPFLKACRGEATETTPIWLMRQAGRYMEEYRRVRAGHNFLELCKNPALCAEIMITAVQRLDVDAAIIFSDLLPILEPMGLDLEFAAGDGPVIHNPVRTTQDLQRIRELEHLDELEFVMETVRQTRAALDARLPVIGFAGSPFTLASYMIEGGSSRNYLHTKTLMYRDPGAWKVLMERIARAVTLYLNGQIAAGAQCVQLFDSWVGCLSPYDYQRFVLPYVQQICEGLVPGVPVISFGTGNPALLPQLAAGGASVVGIDWRIDLDVAWETVGYEHAVQGNLDPTVLLGDRGEIERQARRILDQAAGRPGHIFNLGHGILKETPVDNVRFLVDFVHSVKL